MKKYIPFLLLALAISCTPSKKSGPKFSVTYTKEMSEQAQDGRLLLLLAKNDKAEPRFQMGHGLTAQLIYGLDVNGMKPGDEIVVDGGNAYGYPITSVSNVPAGEYFVQALLNRYETFNLKNGKSVKLPPDMGEGQQWHSKPGNIYSKPVKLKFDPASDQSIKIIMDQKVPPIQSPENT